MLLPRIHYNALHVFPIKQQQQQQQHKSQSFKFRLHRNHCETPHPVPTIPLHRPAASSHHIDFHVICVDVFGFY